LLAIKLLLEFPDAVSIEWMTNGYSVIMRNGRARLE